MNEGTKKRLIAYYDLLAKKEGNPKSAEMMKQLVDYLDEEETKLLEVKLSNNDSFYKRMAAYASTLAPMMVKEETIPYNLDPQRKNTAPMTELSASAGRYDYKQEIREEINGNTFIFKKSFPIDKFRDELNELGEEDKGNMWYVQLDDEGRLVIY